MNNHTITYKQILNAKLSLLSLFEPAPCCGKARHTSVSKCAKTDLLTYSQKPKASRIEVDLILAGESLVHLSGPVGSINAFAGYFESGSDDAAHL